jgi:hypothetical protein
VSARLPKILRRADSERRRVDEFLAAIHASETAQPATVRPVAAPRVERVDTAHGPVWRLDEATRARLGRTDTVELPRVVARASAPLR